MKHVEIIHCTWPDQAGLIHLRPAQPHEKPFILLRHRFSGSIYHYITDGEKWWMVSVEDYSYFATHILVKSKIDASEYERAVQELNQLLSEHMPSHLG